MKRFRYAARMITCSGLFFPAATILAQDEIYYPYVDNGYRIYLSPARHTNAGARGECQGSNENTLAYWNASDAASGNFFPQDNFRERGYTVRLGTGTVQSAINNSNAWGADRHVVVHSNSKITPNCPSTNAAVYGTNIIYRSGSTNGQRLATELNAAIGPVSPGTNDYICYNPGHSCTTIDLAELRDTIAPAAYIEAEFHDWNTGFYWLAQDWYWQWRIAYGTDRHLGFPR